MTRYSHSPVPAPRTPFAILLRKLLGGSIAVGLLMLAAFGIASWNAENRDMRVNLAIQAGFAAKSSQAVFDNIGTSMEMLGRLLAELHIERDPEAARLPLLEFQSTHPEIAAMSLISPKGAVLIDTSVAPGKPLTDLSQDSVRFRALKFDLNTTYSYNIGPNQYGLGLERWHFPFRHTVADKEGDPLFVIQGAIPVESAGQLWSDLPLLSGSRVGLVRDDGYIQLVWPIDDPARAFGNPQQDILVRTIRSSVGRIAGDFDGETGLSGDTLVGSYSRLPNANMAAYVAVPKRLILTRWWEHNYPVLLSFLVYLGVIGLIAWRLGARERQHTRDLLAQSRRDPLTGLSNRMGADELIAMEIARARRSQKPLALFYLDLDKFKDVNDSLGHAKGDMLLQQVAERVQRIMRDGDIFARLGGDEFLAVLPNCPANTCALMVERLRGMFLSPFQLEERDVTVSPSIGICLFPDHGLDSSTLLKNADTAMYEAKHNGGNRCAFYAAEMGERIQRRLQLRHDMRRALEQQEFMLHYQPLVELESGRIVGAEALVRWLDPSQGMRGPAEFIPFAEETGLILPLGEWVLKTASRQAKLWAGQGFDLRVAVNLSTRQFQDPQLLTKIRAILKESGLDASRLELEITESAAMLNPEETIQVLGQLNALGIQIAIDDFGTGYSSLSYLKRIPADIIKIDRSFVSGINTSADDASIVRTVIALAEALEKRCLAEGIETSGHFEALRGLGCHYGQGHWMSKPLPAAEFELLLAKGRRYRHSVEHGATASLHVCNRHAASCTALA